MSQPTFEQWCDALLIPCARTDSGMPVSQPGSSAIMLVLVVLYFLFGTLALVQNHLRGKNWAWTEGDPQSGFANQAKERSRALYGSALIVWGVASAFAGANYQAFTYNIFCTGATACLDTDGEPTYKLNTSWAAIVYLVLQVIGQHMFAIADAFRALRRYVKFVALYSAVVCLVFLIFAATVSSHGVTDLVLVSVVFGLPARLGQIAINAYVRYEPRLFVAWVWAIISAVVYLVFSSEVNEEKLYKETGTYFHANDFLHITGYVLAALLYWGQLYAEDAPPGTFLVTEDQVKEMRKGTSSSGRDKA